MAEGVERCPPDDPNRCQSLCKQGQCPNKGYLLPDKTFAKVCKMHGGGSIAVKVAKNLTKNYRLSKFKVELARHSNSDHIKSLRDEIGILRMIVEERINMCSDANDLILQSHQISDLVIKIEKVITSCHKLEGSLGQTLDKQAILQFASQVIGVIGDELEGQEEVLSNISDKILEIVGNVASAN